MKKILFILSGVMLTVVLIGGGGCVVGEGTQVSPPSISAYVEAPELGGIIYSQQQVGLWVTGEGKTTAAPDIVLLSLGIEAEAKTVAQAQRDAAEAMDGVMKALKANGVAEKDIQTQIFSIDQVRKWIDDEQRYVTLGYQVTNIVVAKIRQIDKAGTVIDAVAEAGGDLTCINGMSFSIDDPTPYYKEARAKAVEDAMAKAEQMADAADIKLGKLLYISESTPVSPIAVGDYLFKAEGAAPSTTPISAGELEIQVTVQMVYNIR